MYIKGRLGEEMASGRQIGYPSIDRPWEKYYGKAIERLEIPACTVYEFLKNKTHEYGDEIALVYLNQKISYRKMMVHIEETAKALKMVGVKENDIVSVCLPNIPEAIYLIYAINRIGAIANMLDVRCGENALKTALTDAESEVLICLDSVSDRFDNILNKTKIKVSVAVSPVESLPAIQGVVAKQLKKELNPVIPKTFDTWKKFLKKGENYNGLLDVAWKANKSAYIAYTGGTTGVPKGVVATNENVIAQYIMQSLFGHNVSQGDKGLAIAPPWTYYGLCNSVNNFLCFGMQVVLIPKLENKDYGRTLNEYKPNYIVTVPAALFSIITSPDLIGEDLSYIKTFIVGADKLDENLEVQMNDFLKSHNCNNTIQKGYGMTEVMAASSCTKIGVNDIGSVGIPCPGVIISTFVEKDGKYMECKIGEQGEIAIEAPTIMKCYFGYAVDETNNVIKMHEDGRKWAHTGDVGYIGEDGRLYVVGRIKRMFTRNGYKIFPATIERCLMKHEAVQQVAVVSKKDDVNGYITKAYIVLKKENDYEQDSLIHDFSEMTAAQLYDYEIPDIYEFIDAMPLTGMGKVDYRALEA